jgi:hypothetical protein
MGPIQAQKSSGRLIRISWCSRFEKAKRLRQGGALQGLREQGLNLREAGAIRAIVEEHGMKRVITPCCGRSEEISEEMYKELASEPEAVLKVTESGIHMPCTGCVEREIKKGEDSP